MISNIVLSDFGAFYYRAYGLYFAPKQESPPHTSLPKKVVDESYLDHWAKDKTKTDAREGKHSKSATDSYSALADSGYKLDIEALKVMPTLDEDIIKAKLRIDRYCNRMLDGVAGDEGKVPSEFTLEHVHLFTRHGDRSLGNTNREVYNNWPYFPCTVEPPLLPKSQ